MAHKLPPRKQLSSLGQDWGGAGGAGIYTPLKIYRGTHLNNGEGSNLMARA